METTEPFVIPTLYRAKISHEISFPIGAEAISRALANTSQLTKLKLRFNAYKVTTYSHLRSGRYEVIAIHHAKDTFSSTILSSTGEPYFYEWEIKVSPVPKVFRHRLRGQILEVALPAMNKWLNERAETLNPGNESLAFFYDEASEQFYPATTEKLHPLRQ